MRDMTTSAQNTAKQIKLITKANVEQSLAATQLLASAAEVRQITDRKVAGVQQTRNGTDDLMRRAQALAALVAQPVQPRNGNSNGSGRPSKSRR